MKEEPGERYIGLVHGRIFLYASKHNLREAKKYIMYAARQNIDTLILPYTQLQGPILYEEHTGKYTIRKNAFTVPGPLIGNLSIVAKNHGVDLLITGLYEKAGPKLYITGLGIPAGPGELFYKTRKIILSEYEKNLGFSPGKSPKLISLSNISYGLIYDSEILYPEMLRLLQLMGSNIILYGMHPNNIIPNYSILLKTYSYISDTIIACTGSTVYHMDRERYTIPTIVYKSGEKILEHDSDETALILIPKKSLIKSKGNISGELLNLLYRYTKLTTKIIQNMRKRGG